MSIDDLFDKIAFAILYLAVAFVGLAIVIGVLVYFFKKDKFDDFKKYFIGIGAGMALCALTVLTYIKVESGIDKDSYGLVFYPVLAEIVIAVAGIFAMLICSLFNKKAVKIAGITMGVLLLGGFIAMMVEMSKYYDVLGNLSKGDDFSLAGLTVSAVIFMVLIAVIYFLGDKRNISDTRSIVYGAISIAMSFALSYIKLVELPQGGSITLASLLPLIIYCCMFGTRRGVIVCLIYGVLQAIQDPWIIHPMQFLLDYPLAFGMIGVSGIFVEKGVFKFKGKMQRFNQMAGFVCGALIAVIGRFICHVLSGIFAFTSYGNVGAALVFSLGYNSFAFVDIAIVLGVGIILFLSRSFTAQMIKSSDISKTVQAAPVDEIEEVEEEDEIDALIGNQDSVNDAQNTSDVQDWIDGNQAVEVETQNEIENDKN